MLLRPFCQLRICRSMYFFSITSQISTYYYILIAATGKFKQRYNQTQPGRGLLVIISCRQLITIIHILKFESILLTVRYKKKSALLFRHIRKRNQKENIIVLARGEEQMEEEENNDTQGIKYSPSSPLFIHDVTTHLPIIVKKKAKKKP